ncbi:MAG TPA: chitosanase, partial [Saprospiraceae bacterium]|nr:chitosanase [Saprospiraceae bacterium]
LIVTAKKLNKRKYVPANLPETAGIIGFVNNKFSFQGEEVKIVPNPALGKWYKDRDNNYYWGGGLQIMEDILEEEVNITIPDNFLVEMIPITTVDKRKIEQVINAFESASIIGNYAKLTKEEDHLDSITKIKSIQISYGRSQTTEYSTLKALVTDYIDKNGLYAKDLLPYLNRVGKKPSLANDNLFCKTLINAGKKDPIMKICQDNLFEIKYYQPAFSWFSQNGFSFPLSMLVIYDSKIQSGSVIPALRIKFATVVPKSGGDEKEWITNYVNVRHEWLSTYYKNTNYRTKCFKEQIKNNNWDLSQSINANGHIIN